MLSPELLEVTVMDLSTLTVLPIPNPQVFEFWVSHAKGVGLRKGCQGLEPEIPMLGYCVPSVEELDSQYQGISPEYCIIRISCGRHVYLSQSLEGPLFTHLLSFEVI